MLFRLIEAISAVPKGVLCVTVRLFFRTFFFRKLKLSAHYINITDLQMLIDRPQDQNMRELENEFCQISIFM